MPFLPFERVVLIIFAYVGYGATFTVGLITFASVRRALNDVVSYIIALITALTFSLVWADGIAHYGKGKILNYYYNPNVMAIGEHEGWMGPTSQYGYAIWLRDKCRSFPDAVPWMGDPGSGSYCK